MGGGGSAPRALRLFQEKKVPSTHYVPTTCAHTPVVHHVQERVACPSWRAPPWGPETWVMEVVELKEVKEGGLIVLVQGTIKVTLLFTGHITCRTGSFLCGLKKSVPSLQMLHSWGSPNKEGQNQNWLPNPCLLRAHKWAEMLHNPCILRGPQQRGQHQSTKKRTNKKFSILSLTLPRVLQIAPTWPMTFQLQRHCVWATSGIPLHRGGIDIWSKLVFIHHWVLLKKLEYFEYGHMG